MSNFAQSGELPSAGLRAAGTIHLCKARYCVATTPELVAIDLFCQSVVLDGCAYAWVDGVDYAQPMLIPVHLLEGFERAGTLGQYLRQERHIDLGEAFDDLLGICLSTEISATNMIRACEFMHADGMSPQDAIDAAKQWGELLREMDWRDQACWSYSVTKH